MGARSDEVHRIALKRGDQTEIGADMALAVIAPIALEGVVQPFRAKRRIVGDEQHHRFLELVHVVAAAARQPLPILDEPLFVGCRSEEHTSELQSLMRNSYAVFCLKKKKQTQYQNIISLTQTYNN